VIRLAFRVRREHAELVLAELLELVPGGVEESEPSPELVEYAVYGAPGELPELPDLRAAARGAQVEVSTSEVADDWHERWKRFHQPILIDAPAAAPEHAGQVPALCVLPPWERERGADAASGNRATEQIVIDPGRAFGTGAHATTRMCLELLLEIVLEARSVDSKAPLGAALDVGTGSGVLAIAAARLGFVPVLALDNEHESVTAARANAAVNGASIEVRELDLRRASIPWVGGLQEGAAHAPPPRQTIVLANLLRPLLLDLARAIKLVPGCLLASGLLAEQVDEVVAVFGARHRMRERRRLYSGEWAAVWLSAREAY
jgi:ribosomal protein L11 methyltransferase